MSHELRTPLSTITLGLAFLGNQRYGDDAEEQVLKDMAGSCAECVLVLDNLLAHDRIESAMVMLDKSVFEVKAFVEECMLPYVATVRYYRYYE